MSIPEDCVTVTRRKGNHREVELEWRFQHFDLIRHKTIRCQILSKTLPGKRIVVVVPKPIHV